MQILGLGLPRTGSTSLKHALEHLGVGPVDHMTELMCTPDRWSLWPRFAAGEPVQAALFAGYAAVADNPACCFGERLTACYPNAKVILNVRDPKAWHRSYLEHIHTFTFETERQRSPELHAFMDWFRSFWVDEFLGGAPHDVGAAVRRFELHTEQVRALVPPERLLIRQCGEGWGRLCTFLDVPVPDIAYPRRNTSQFIERTGLHQT